MAKSTAESWGCTVDYTYQRRYPPLVNAREQTDVAIAAAVATVGAENVDRNTAPVTGASQVRSAKAAGLHETEHPVVYRIEGDTLTTSYVSASDSAKRPTDFEGKKPGEWLTVFKRKK